MPIGAFKLNGLAKFTVTAVAEVIRYKKSVIGFGNVQVDTAQSKFGNASALFDGTGDYFVISNSSDLNFGTGDFTIEAWVRFSSVSGIRCLYDDREIAAGTGGPLIFYNGTFIYYGGGGTRISGGTAVINTWYHWAVSRSGGSTKMFINGTQVGSTYADTLNYSTAAEPMIGGNRQSNGDNWAGWMDEIRVSNSGRYTANFTAPTTTFVNDANTLLLMHCDGTDAITYFEDDNGVREKKSIIAVGNAKVSTAQSQFGGTSALFDAVDDYIYIGNPVSIGTGDFTIEYWVRPTTLNVAIHYDGRTADNQAIPTIYADGSTLYYFVNNTVRITATSALAATTWKHIAVSRSGTSTKMFVNGTQVGSTWTDTTNYISHNPYFGVYIPNMGADLNGHIDEVRISNTARYTANFTSSTTPFVNDANTLLLMHCHGQNNSTVFLDDNGSRNQKNISVIGNTQISTAQSKFGGSSALFDGTGDYLQTSDTIVTFGTGDFTIECWARASTSQANDGIFQLSPTGFATSGTPVNRGLALGFYNSSGFGWVYYGGNADFGGGISPAHSATTWYHLAMVRSNSTLQIYINGTSLVSITDTTNYTAHKLIIGGYYSTDFLMTGHVDEFRISNTARYTANFTAPTTTFVNDANTLLLLHCDGTNASTNFVDDNA